MSAGGTGRFVPSDNHAVSNFPKKFLSFLGFLYFFIAKLTNVKYNITKEVIQMNLTKQDLIDIIATTAQTTEKTAKAFLSAYTQAVMEALSRGDSVQLIGFGKFKVRTRSARKGRNPKTGEALDIPAKTVPVFRPGATMKRAAAKAP